MRVLANDGISEAGVKRLEENGVEVSLDKIEQENLAQGINDGKFDAILVRSATQVRKEVIDACPNLKLIGRGGVGMDNIDVSYGRSKGLHVVNTPGASSQSVAELAVGSMFSMARFTYDAGRKMPEKGGSEFKALKKSYGKGTELQGKTLGVIGFGGIGRSLAKYALGCGMNVIYNDLVQETVELDMNIAGHQFNVTLNRTGFEDLISSADFISLHVPKQADGRAVIGAGELAKMKDGVCLVNTSRGGSIDEMALIEALDSGKVKAATLDVFEGEPNPRPELLQHPRILSTPHIGGSTVEAQERIGIELANQIITLLK